jgi:hypothetical protein
VVNIYVCSRCGDERRYVNCHPPLPQLCERPLEEAREVNAMTPYYSYQCPATPYVRTEKVAVRCNGNQLLCPALPKLVGVRI